MIKKYSIFILFYLLLFLAFQSFYYLKEFGPLYYLSKVAFVLGFAIFAFYILLGKGVNRLSLFLIFGYSLYYLILVLYSFFQGLDVVETVILNTKFLNVFQYFIVFTIFSILASKNQDKEFLVVLSVSLLFIYYSAYFLFPPENYWVQGSDLIGNQFDKGFRYRFPLLVMLMGFLYLFVEFVLYKKKNLIRLSLFFLISFVFFYYMIFYHQQRMMLLALFIAVSVFWLFNAQRVISALMVFAFLAVIILGIYLLVSNLEGFISALYQTSMGVRLDFLQDLGAQSSTLVEVLLGRNMSLELNLALQDEGHYFSDLGWFGIYYRYGAVAVLLGFFVYGTLFYKILSIKHHKVYKWFFLILAIYMVFQSIINPSVIYGAGVIFSIIAMVDVILKKEYLIFNGN